MVPKDPTGASANALQLSRRNFLRNGAVASLAIPAGLRGSALDIPSGGDFQQESNFLEAAVQSANWVRSVERKANEGSYWLPQPDHPERLTTVSPQNGFYSGSAGTVLLFLQLAKATQDSSYLGDATRGADFVAATWRDLPRGPEHIPGTNLSFYSGLSGAAFVLAETWKATGDAKYKTAALEAAEYIAKAAHPGPAGVAWSASPGVIGDGSIILYLLYAAQTFQVDEFRQLASNGGDRLLAVASKPRGGGLKWKGASPEALGLPADTYFPNFELGTAGVAYVLARLYEETKDTRFLEGAKQGAAHLQSIAFVDRDSALIPYRYPDLTDLYYLGFCHGPAGSARLFYQLFKVTKDPAYQEWTERLARGIIASGIPDNLTPGFWNVVCQCCGSAGVTDFFLGLWAATGKTDYYAFANRVAGQALGRQSNLDGKGYRWYQAWTRVKPWEVTAETGYSIGASGVATALLHAALAQKGEYEAILLPDNPFPHKREEDLGGARSRSADRFDYLP
jgi:lantibiotic modifying enzyme